MQKMENRYGFMKQGRSEEFREEDVWDMMNEDFETRFKNSGDEFRGEKPVLSISRRLPSAARMIPGAQRHEHLRDGDDGKTKVKQQQCSAPVNVPDWRKVYGKSPRKKIYGTTASTSSTYDDHGCYDYDDDDVDEGGMALPPHEWLAKKLSRSQISSFSVCEGAGRTLKGRDLSRVRNAVLSKTGFI